MSAPLLALALATMCALFSAAAADTAQVMGLRNQAADDARRVAVSTLDACAIGDGGHRRCMPSQGCTQPQCAVCWRGGAIRADVALDWSPVLLRGLTPARGRHALSLDVVDVADLTGSTLPSCT
ncbi:hypothetical protein [Candidatus Poriferisodalis sp.]|uniref:hypothetical protein n=1 Tax=Candidatus Poriferisodalis sp. TaxID=3101277 RepID=UPI003B51DD11